MEEDESALAQAALDLMGDESGGEGSEHVTTPGGSNAASDDESGDETPAASSSATHTSSFKDLAFVEGPGRNRSKRQLERDLAAEAERIRRRNAEEERRYLAKQKRKDKAASEKAPIGPLSSKTPQQISAMRGGEAEYDETGSPLDASSASVAYRAGVHVPCAVRLDSRTEDDLLDVADELKEEGSAPAESRESSKAPSPATREASREPSKAPSRAPSEKPKEPARRSRSPTVKSTKSKKVKSAARIASSSDSSTSPPPKAKPAPSRDSSDSPPPRVKAKSRVASSSPDSPAPAPSKAKSRVASSSPDSPAPQPSKTKPPRVASSSPNSPAPQPPKAKPRPGSSSPDSPGPQPPKAKPRPGSSSPDSPPPKRRSASPGPKRSQSPKARSRSPKDAEETAAKPKKPKPFLVETPLDFLVAPTVPKKGKKGKGKDKDGKDGKEKPELSRQQREQMEYEEARRRQERMRRIDEAKRRARAQPAVSVNQLIKERSQPQARGQRPTTFDADEGDQRCYVCKKMFHQDDCSLEEGTIYCSIRCLQRIIDKAHRVTAGPETRVVVAEERTSLFLRGPSAPTLGELSEWLKEHPAFFPILSDAAPTSKAKDKDKAKGPGPAAAKAAAKAKAKERDGPKDSEAANQIRLNVRRSLFDRFTAEADDLETVVEVEDIRNVTIGTEEALFYQHAGAVSSKRYKDWFAAFLKALKENKELGRRLLTHHLSPDELVRMSGDQMLGKEPEPKEAPAVNAASAASSTDLLGAILGEASSDTTAQHKSHLFDANCKICSGKKRAAEKRKEHLEKLEKKLEEEKKKKEEKRAQEALEKLEREAREREILGVPAAPEPSDAGDAPAESGGWAEDGGGDGDDGADGGYGGEEDDYEEGGVPKKRQEDDEDRGSPALPASGRFGGAPWRGEVVVGKSRLCAEAKEVSGDYIRLVKYLPTQFQVVGRIPPNVVLSYLGEQRALGKDLVVFALSCPSDPQDEAAFMRLVTGMLTKGRFSVAKADEPSYIKDIYLLPHQPHAQVPEQLLPFTGPGLPEDEAESILVVMVPGAKLAPEKPRSEESWRGKAKVKDEPRTKEEPRRKRSRWEPAEPKEEDGLVAKRLQKEIKAEPGAVPAAAADLDPVGGAYDESRLREEVLNLIATVKACTNPSVVSHKVSSFMELSELKLTAYEEKVLLSLLEEKIARAAEAYPQAPAQERRSPEEPGELTEADGEALAEGIGELKRMLELHVFDGGKVPDSLSPDFVRWLTEKYAHRVRPDQQDFTATSANLPREAQPSPAPSFSGVLAPPPPPPPSRPSASASVAASVDMELEEGEVTAPPESWSMGVPPPPPPAHFADPAAYHQQAWMAPPPPPPPQDSDWSGDAPLGPPRGVGELPMRPMGPPPQGAWPQGPAGQGPPMPPPGPPPPWMAPQPPPPPQWPGQHQPQW